MTEITVTDLAALGSGITLIDVREADEFAEARVDGATNLPLSQLPGLLDQVPSDETVYVMCLSGGRSARATAYLEAEGRDVVNVLGGISAWHGAGLPVITGGSA